MRRAMGKALLCACLVSGVFVQLVMSSAPKAPKKKDEVKVDVGSQKLKPKPKSKKDAAKPTDQPKKGDVVKPEVAKDDTGMLGVSTPEVKKWFAEADSYIKTIATSLQKIEKIRADLDSQFKDMDSKIDSFLSESSQSLGKSQNTVQNIAREAIMILIQRRGARKAAADSSDEKTTQATSLDFSKTVSKYQQQIQKLERQLESIDDDEDALLLTLQDTGETIVRATEESAQAGKHRSAIAKATDRADAKSGFDSVVDSSNRVKEIENELKRVTAPRFKADIKSIEDQMTQLTSQVEKIQGQAPAIKEQGDELLQPSEQTRAPEEAEESAKEKVSEQVEQDVSDQVGDDDRNATVIPSSTGKEEEQEALGFFSGIMKTIATGISGAYDMASTSVSYVVSLVTGGKPVKTKKRKKKKKLAPVEPEEAPENEPFKDFKSKEKEKPEAPEVDEDAKECATSDATTPDDSVTHDLVEDDDSTEEKDEDDITFSFDVDAPSDDTETKDDEEQPADTKTDDVAPDLVGDDSSTEEKDEDSSDDADTLPTDDELAAEDKTEDDDPFATADVSDDSEDTPADEKPDDAKEDESFTDDDESPADDSDDDQADTSASETEDESSHEDSSLEDNESEKEQDDN